MSIVDDEILESYIEESREHLADIENDLHLLFCSAEHKEFSNTLNSFIMFAYIIFEVGLIGINIIGVFRQGSQHGPYDR